MSLQYIPTANQHGSTTVTEKGGGGVSQQRSQKSKSTSDSGSFKLEKQVVQSLGTLEDRSQTNTLFDKGAMATSKGKLALNGKQPWMDTSTGSASLISRQISVKGPRDSQSHSSVGLHPSDVSMLHIHPQTPPIPAEHPSAIRMDRQRTTSSSSHFSNPRVQNLPNQDVSQTILNPKLSQNMNGSKQPPLVVLNPKKASSSSTTKHKSSKIPLASSSSVTQHQPSLDPDRVLDPRSRAKLELEPVLNPQQVRILNSPHHPSSHAARPVQVTTSANPLYPVSLSEPTLNSSKKIQLQMKSVTQSQFDPVDAMAKFMLHNRKEAKFVQDRVTAKGLNLRRDAEWYGELHGPTSEELRPGGLVTHKSRALPRAKKATSQAWLDSLECKPELESFRQSRLEVDTICLPYPQLSDSPFTPIEGSPTLSTSSMEVNFEDSRRWVTYERPVTLEDL